MVEMIKLIENEYNLELCRITTRNPQANSIIERVHQTIGNMVQMFSYKELDKEDPWMGILSAVAFGVRAMVHTTTRATPSQLVFRRDAILVVPHVVDWEYVRKRKEKLIKKNNQKQNKNRMSHKYRIEDLVLLKGDFRKKFGLEAYSGPLRLIEVLSNGMVCATDGTVTDTDNIRNIHPYYE